MVLTSTSNSGASVIMGSMRRPPWALGHLVDCYTAQSRGLGLLDKEGNLVSSK